MKTILTAFLFAACIFGLSAQDIISFEDISVPPDSFLNGSDGSGGFQSGPLFLPNDYNTNFQSWTGWAISSSTDTLTPGFTNQYSAITGSGFGGSSNYAVSYIFSGGENRIRLDSSSADRPINGFYLTNSTYAYLAMRDGDAFSKKFGGASGDDPDYLSVAIRKYQGGALSTDSIEVFLADFRFADNSQDYILDEWTWVDLSALGPADSLSFRMHSSDVGQFGINTPTYFCLDHVEVSAVTTSATNFAREIQLKIFPNPVQDLLHIQMPGTETRWLRLTDLQGRLLWQSTCRDDMPPLDLSSLPTGTYVLRVWNKKGDFAQKLICKQ